MALVLQPSILRVTAQVVIVGCVLSTTLTTWVQISGEQPEQVTELWIVYDPQVVPELTVTDGFVEEPTIEAPVVLLMIDQL